MARPLGLQPPRLLVTGRLLGHLERWGRCGERVQHPVAPPPPAVASHRVAGFPGPRLAAVPFGSGHAVGHPAR